MRKLAAVLVLLAGCETTKKRLPTWEATVALEASVKLGGCAIGDLDPGRPGNEIAAVAGNGEVYLVYREGGAWKHEVIYKSPGEMIQCAIGDADPGRAGEELVAVGVAAGGEDDGGPGAAMILHREGSSWVGEPIFEDAALLHGVCVVEGGVIVVGFSRKVFHLVKGPKGWQATEVAVLPGPGKAAVPFGTGAVIACQDGSLVRVSRSESGWSFDEVDKTEAGQSRLGTDGRRIIVSTDDGKLAIVEDGVREVIYSETSKLRGAVLADIDAVAPGDEAATAGYRKTVTVLTRLGNSWRAETVFTDTDRFHHLACGELDESCPGRELAACGYSGRLVVVRRTEK